MNKLNHKLLDVNYRVNKLIQLKEEILANEPAIYEALYLDLNKSEQEAFLSEVGQVLAEVNLYIKKLNKWAKTTKVKTPMSMNPSKSYQVYQPLGKVLIISPWNYPFNLSMIPLIDAFGAGNSIDIKLSEFSMHTSRVMKKILNNVFDETEVRVHLGEADVAINLLKDKYDLIFFTGNEKVGHSVYQKAAETLTPCVLELGGKSPTIILEDALLYDTAKKLAWAKGLNSGQTCVAPDYVFVPRKMLNETKKALDNAFKEQFGEDILANPTYPKIISPRHFNRILALDLPLKYDQDKLKIEPYVFEASLLDKTMQQELFAPILPLVPYDNLEDVISYINEHNTPLALYIFGRNKHTINKIITETQFATGAVNNAIVQISNNNYGFGGLGHSGFGKYHGYTGFKTFSHEKNYLYSSHKLNMNQKIQTNPKIGKFTFNMLKKIF
ncbi:aldehyde dehydrogenase family protein [Mycoplasma corogypsi]|uniref:aldehyde dehydrogenase family protein n=1 Tax=Mycoplasma corogypsi TaxID=2106 RepID=UPI003872CE75